MRMWHSEFRMRNAFHKISSSNAECQIPNSERPTPTDAEDARAENVGRLAEIGTAVGIHSGHGAHVEQVEEVANRLEPLPSNQEKLGDSKIHRLQFRKPARSTSFSEEGDRA